MKDVYVKNPQMGDPASVDPRLAEIGQNIEKLQFEAQKFEVSYVCWHREAVSHEKKKNKKQIPARQRSSAHPPTHSPILG